MILDAYLLFSQNQTVAMAVGNVDSTNIIDLHIASPGIPVLLNNQGARDFGIGDDPALKILVQLTAALTTGTTATIAVNLQGSPDNGSGSPAGFVTWYTSPTAQATSATPLAVGTRLMDMDVPRPPPGQPIPRFFKLNYVIAGATTTAGTVTSAIVLDRHDQVYNAALNNVLGGYPPGIAIAN